VGKGEVAHPSYLDDYGYAHDAPWRWWFGEGGDCSLTGAPEEARQHNWADTLMSL
jgi:hypothetical protein